MYVCRGALYVGAFLRRPGTPETVVSAPLEETEKDALPDPAAHLYEIGTFAQVHAIIPGAELSDTSHLMLLGHKRIRRLTTVKLLRLRWRNS